MTDLVEIMPKLHTLSQTIVHNLIIVCKLTQHWFENNMSRRWCLFIKWMIIKCQTRFVAVFASQFYSEEQFESFTYYFQISTAMP